MKKASPLLIAATVLLLVFLSYRWMNRPVATSAQQTDTLDVNLVVEPVTEHLPDTAFLSAERISFTVDRKDTVNDGRISSLEDCYSATSSVLTFRRGIRRQGDFDGRLDSLPSRMRIEWRVDTERDTADTIYGPWGGGTGWTGQPLYVEWPDSSVGKFKNCEVVTADFDGREIIVGSLCGKVYFLNPDNGSPTRQPIDIGNPIKGTPSIDPSLNGNLYVGQGTPAQRPFGAAVVNLFAGEITHFFAEDSEAYRRWGAYDSSPLRMGQFLFRPGENGSLYKFTIEQGTLALHSVLRYRVNGLAPGIESSMAVYRNYGFITDNHGNIIAVNLDTMCPVWHYALGDDTDASPMLTLEEDEPYLYVGCEVDRQGGEGYANFAKLNALTGEAVWKTSIEGINKLMGAKQRNGGFFASPLLGAGDCEGLIFTNVVKNTEQLNGAFLAIDRTDGRIVYELPFRHYSWASPAGFLTADGQMVVATGDGIGQIRLIAGRTGEVLATQRIGVNFESSPLGMENSLFIGSRENGIYKITVE